MDDQSAVAGGAMGIVLFLVICAVMGLVLGALARLLLPGRDDMSLLRTTAYGLGGSLLGGIIGRALGVTNSVVAVVIAVGFAMALIWFFTRRGQRARSTM